MKDSRLFLYAPLVYTLLFIVHTVLFIRPFPISEQLLLSLTLTSEVVLLVSFYSLISVLQHFHERRSIVRAVYTYLAYESLLFGMNRFVANSPDISVLLPFTAVLGMLRIVLLAILCYQTFQVKNESIRRYFQWIGSLLVLEVAVTISTPMVELTFGVLWSDYLPFFILLPMTAIFLLHWKLRSAITALDE